MTKLIKTKKPEIGDIFFGENSFIIGRKKNFDLGTENIVEVCITENQCYKKINKVESIMSKGKLFQFNKTINKKFDIIDESRKNAIYVVEFVEHKEKLELLHSVLPESYLVRARRLKDSKYDPNGEVIEFYTYGNYDNTFNGELEIIGKLKNLK